MFNSVSQKALSPTGTSQVMSLPCFLQKNATVLNLLQYEKYLLPYVEPPT